MFFPGDDSSAGGCAFPFCPEPGEYPAPVPGKEGEYIYFCLRHVREYNKRYNFFSGMTGEQAHAFRKYATAGERRTRARPIPPAREQADKRAEEHKKAAAERARKRIYAEAAPYLAALDLAAGASKEEIRARYKQLAKTVHPDIAGEEEGERMKNVTRAYKELKRIYDIK